MRSTTEKDRVLKSVDRALTLLEVVVGLDDDAGLSEIAEQAKLPRTTAVRLLRTLERLGAVHRDRTCTRYRLGSALVDLGRAARRQFDLYHAVEPFLMWLAERTGETAFLAIRNGEKAVCVAQYSSSYTIRGAIPRGQHLPLHATAAGKALLAGLSASELDHHVGLHGFASMTENTIVNAQQHRSELASIRDRGFAIDDEETEMSDRSIACPVLGEDSETVAAVSITGPTNRITPERVEEYVRDIAKAAKQISVLMKHWVKAPFDSSSEDGRKVLGVSRWIRRVA